MAWPEDVTKNDLRIDYFRAPGPGGQNVNKRSTACRITHLPTGLTGQSSDERSQPQNKKIAFTRLTDQLIPLMRRAAAEAQAPIESRSTDRVRTYHQPQQRVTDHRLPGKKWTYDGVLEGNQLQEIIEEVMINDDV